MKDTYVMISTFKKDIHVCKLKNNVPSRLKILTLLSIRRSHKGAKGKRQS